MTKVLMISGSPSATSRTSGVVDLVGADLYQRHAIDVTTLSVRDLPPVALLHAQTADPAIAAVLDAVRAADGIVVATPIYQAAYSGLLKVLLDLLPKRAFAGKVVLPLATAGSLSYLLAVDYALRPVLSALGAEHVLAGHLLVSEAFGEDADGRAVVQPPARAALDTAVATFAAALRA